MGYYDEVLQEISSAIEKGDLAEASFQIKKELSMPYVPKEVQEQLEKMNQDVIFRMSDAEKNEEASLDSLLAGLRGSAEQQLAAASGLSGRNLRDCLQQIQSYLANDPQPEASALILEAIAEQAIDEEFSLKRDGMEYDFYGDEMIPVARQEGFQSALKKIQELFAKNPGMASMARQLLVHDAYMNLPLSYEKEEGEMLAEKAALEVCDLMGDKEMEEEIKERYSK